MENYKELMKIYLSFDELPFLLKKITLTQITNITAKEMKALIVPIAVYEKQTNGYTNMILGILSGEN